MATPFFIAALVDPVAMMLRSSLIRVHSSLKETTKKYLHRNNPKEPRAASQLCPLMWARFSWKGAALTSFPLCPRPNVCPSAFSNLFWTSSVSMECCFIVSIAKSCTIGAKNGMSRLPGTACLLKLSAPCLGEKILSELFFFFLVTLKERLLVLVNLEFLFST